MRPQFQRVENEEVTEDTTGQDKTGQDKTRQDKTGQAQEQVGSDTQRRRGEKQKKTTKEEGRRCPFLARDIS